MKILIWYLFLFLFPVFLKAQDTIFVNKHIFSTPVRNVFRAENSIFVKTGDALYKRKNNKWVQQEKKLIKPYVFYDNDFYQVDQIPSNCVFDAQLMTYLIPQKSISNGTIAKLDDELFVSVGGSLFEYYTPSFYKHLYKECSIRNIYIEDGFKVVSTYSGIFINDSIKAPDPSYSSGYFCKTFDKYYLCNDKLYSYNNAGNFTNIKTAINASTGAIHKVVAYQNNIYSLNFKSINKLDSVYNPIPVHNGFRYNDLEVVDSLLMFCTSTGELFQFDGRQVKMLLNVKSRLRDIYQVNKTLYLSSDAGLYTIQNLQIETLTLVAKLPLIVKVQLDQFKNIWIATENGLFILTDKQKEPIPLIEGVEFNRAALTQYEDKMFAGSISGLYVINIYKVVEKYLPVYLNNKRKEELAKGQFILFYFAIPLVLLAGCFYFYKMYRNNKVILTKKEDIVLSLDKIALDIQLNNIMTVEGLAEFYKTNTVQLNRLFKTFDTTPGKLLKKVKLDMVKEMLNNGENLEQIVGKVGYSSAYIKKEIAGLKG